MPKNTENGDQGRKKISEPIKIAHKAQIPSIYEIKG
jgi:hypothetical protein